MKTTTAIQPATGSLVMTWRKNAVDQALVITVLAGGAIGVYADEANSFHVDAGDVITIRGHNNAGTSSTTINSIMFTILPDTPGTSVIGGYVNSGSVGTTLEAAGPFDNTSPATSALNDHEVPMTRAGVLRNFHIYTDNGAGTDVVTFWVAVNGVQTAITTTATEGGAAGWHSDTTHSVTIARGDRVSVQLQVTTGIVWGFGIRGWSLEFAKLP